MTNFTIWNHTKLARSPFHHILRRLRFSFCVKKYQTVDGKGYGGDIEENLNFHVDLTQFSMNFPRQ